MILSYGCPSYNGKLYKVVTYGYIWLDKEHVQVTVHVRSVPFIHYTWLEHLDTDHA